MDLLKSLREVVHKLCQILLLDLQGLTVQHVFHLLEFTLPQLGVEFGHYESTVFVEVLVDAISLTA
jgi:hypothetical protein